jgi:putative DNA methylase
LFSVYEVTRTEELREGLNYLRAEVPNYWNKRKLLIAMLDYVIRFESIEHMSHWQDDVASAKLLAGAIQNDTPGA